MAFVAAATAFTHSSHTIGKSAFSNVSPAKPMTFPKVNESKTMLMERRWNFNEARGPWGMKKNAEIWNGRVAQMGFTVVLLQELITGKGVIQGLSDGDFVSYALLGATLLSVVGLSAFLAFKGKEKDIVY